MLKYLFFIVLISTYILGDSKTIVFAPLPTKDAQELHTQFLPLVDFLEKKLNVKIKIDYNSDYEKLLAKFINKEIDIAYLGPLPYAYLEDRYEYATPLVNFINSKGEVSYTCSFVTFIANDRPIENMIDTKIALSQPLSTCGYLFVNSVLKELNSDLEKNKYRYLENHDNVALSIIRDDFKYGGLRTDIAEEYDHLGLKELYRSSSIPNFILVGNSETLDPNILEEIKNSILFAEEKELTLLHKSMKFGAKEAVNEDYEYLRRILKSSKISYEGNF